MAKLTEYTRYADAQKFADSQALWDLFDGDREYLNIAHECVSRHADGSGRAAVVTDVLITGSGRTPALVSDRSSQMLRPFSGAK